MRTLTELLKTPDSPLTKEEYNNFQHVVLGGRTDGKPHEEFEYDPVTGEEVPPCDNEEIMNMSRSQDPKVREVGIKMRWKLFQKRLDESVTEICNDFDVHLGFRKKDVSIH